MSKIVIGVDQGSYALSGKEITLSGLSFTPIIEQLAYVYNITQDKLYYAQVEALSRCTIAGLVITIDSFFPAFDVNDDVHIQFFTQAVRIADSDGVELRLETDGAMPVVLQDQTTPVVIAKFSQVTDQTTMSSTGAIGDMTINLTSTAGAVDLKHITLFNPTSERFSLFTQVGAVATGNTITLDTPLDFAYPSGTFVDLGTNDMSVDGSGTTQVFGLRGGGTPPGVDLDFDVTRLIITCLTATTPQLDEFGDITALTNGLVCRRRDGSYYNIFNVKDNIDIAGILYDFTLLSALGAGQNGFYARLTFAGQSKIGVAQRLSVGEDMEILIQDDLTGIQRLEIVAEGHIVQD